jgi:hypothetical protein
MKKNGGMVLVIFLMIILSSFLIFANSTLPKPPESPTNYDSDNGANTLVMPLDNSSEVYNSEPLSSLPLIQDLSFDKIKPYFLSLIVLLIVIFVVLLILKAKNKSPSFRVAREK